jgi:hypothetical protein
MKSVVLACVAALGIGNSVNAAEQPKACNLRQYASLPLVTMSDNKIAVPVTIAGVERKFLLMMSPHTGIMKSISDELGLSGSRLPGDMTIDYFGRSTRLQTRLPEIQMGVARGENLAVVMMSPDQVLPEMSGVLGIDILSKFDVELDFNKNRLNLFSQDHCAGKVVYWSEAYAVVALEDDAVGYPTVKMQLDGKEVTVGLLPQDYPAGMTFALAHKLFGLEEQSSGVTGVPRRGGAVSYRYPFKLLEIGGLAIKNPEIGLTGGSRDPVCDARGTYTAEFGQGTLAKFCFGSSDITLGLKELRKLHLYFAFGEKKLYLTAADASPHEPKKITP